LLGRLGVIDEARLPTNAILAVVSALYKLIQDDETDKIAIKEKVLKAYIWRSFFTNRYENSAASRAYADFKEIKILLTRLDKEADSKDLVNIPIFNWFYVQECLTMLGFTVPSLVRMLIFILIVFGIDISSRKIGFGKWYADLPHKWHIVLLYACVLCVLFFSAGSGGDFIYFKF
ncbi:MAG: hypothetical protein RR654_10410, partial [Oscillospiraceae bacterium]